MGVYQRFYHTVRDLQGNVVTGASCTVYNAGTGTLATIYNASSTDADPQALSNPFVTGSDGILAFFALDGQYDVRIDGGSIATQHMRVTLSTADAGVGAVAATDLADTASVALGDALVGVKKTIVGAIATTQHKANENRVACVKTDFGAKGDGVWTGTPGATDSTATGTDDTAAFAAAIASGGKRIRIPEGTYILAGGFQIPSYMEFDGDGMERTFLYHKGGSNNVMFTNAGGSGAGNVAARFTNMTIHGNAFRDAGHAPQNASGNVNNQAFNWNTGSGFNMPGLILQNVKIVSFSGDATNNVANYFYGSGWIEANNLHIVDCGYPSAMMLKCSDSVINALYTSGCGGWGALPGVRIAGGADNRFVGCYFGGGGSVNQVQLEGSSYNQFIGCTNDNTYGSCYKFMASAGVQSLNNLVLGGSATNADAAVTHAYPHVLLQDASSNNLFIGVKFDNTLGYKPTYAVSETGTAGNNLFMGCFFSAPSTYQNGQANLRVGGLSRIVESPGYRGFGFTGASASTATAQALANGTQTVVNFSTIESDQDSAVTTGASWKYTAPASGLYEIVGCVSFTGAASSNTIVEVWKNGAAALRPIERGISMGSTYNENFSASLPLVAGDYIDIRALIFNTGMTLRNDAKFNWVRIKRVSGS